MKLACYVSLFACFAVTSHANTEKAIFIAPPSLQVPDSISELNLDVLTPSEPSLRKALPVVFPTASASRTEQGEISWYLLAALNPQQRYELRICWAASQPTKFDIEVLEASDILKEPQLHQQLTRFSQRPAPAGRRTFDSKTDSVLLLRIISTADFYTSNQTLVKDPPPVDVDIILDPFLANIFPRSLLFTAGYIVVLAIASWYISGFLWTLIKSTGTPEDGKTHAE